MTQSLATRELTDKQIRDRIELNKQAGWGLEKGSSSQLNMVYLTCQRHRLLPGEDVTLYDGRVWLTIDGRVKLLRRHPEYRGFACRPLSKDEKALWGYDEADIVVECTIRTSTWGEIAARGKASKAEAQGLKVDGQRLNYVARIHPVEMAEKRAIARAERLAFGTDVYLDEDTLEDEARLQVTERNDPARVKANAARHAEIFDGEDAWPGDPEPKVQATDALADELRQLLQAAEDGELEFKDCDPAYPAPRAEVERAIARLQARIDEAMADDATVG